MSFGQWWTRAVRGGHALAHRYAEHGGPRYRDGRRELASDLFWGSGAASLIAVAVWPTRGLALALAGGIRFVAWRVYRHYRRVASIVRMPCS